MKLSPETVEILKNYSTINQSLLFRQGSSLSTISGLSTVLAIANVAESFPVTCAIYDMNKFLAKLSLYKDCDVEFDTDKVNFVSVDKKRADYIKYCSQKVIITPPTNSVNLGVPDYKFTLDKADLEWQRKSAGISGSPNFIFKSDGAKIYLVSTDIKDNSSDYSKTEIAAGDGSVFEVVMKVENFKMIDGSYTVEIAKKGLAKFSSLSRDLVYYIAIEADKSKYE